MVEKGDYMHAFRHGYGVPKRKTGYLLWILACMILCTGCSTRRNTSAARAYHALTTRYNTYFNAEEAYYDILEGRENTFQQNYSDLLPFYSSLPAEEKASSGGPFDPVIEKTGKAIKEHSITAKPRRDPSKAHSQAYRQWLRQEEFNPFLKNAWLLRGKAFLQNGDYDEALSVFSGIQRQYSHDRELTDETEIWMLRTYTEMGRIYDAEKTAYTLRNKKLPSRLERLFTAHYTYLLIRRKDFTEAIPYLQKTITQETDHTRKKKLQFLLGQIYAIIGEERKAHLAFEGVKGLRTPPALVQNAARWQSALANDSLSQLFRPVHPGSETPQTAAIAATNSTAIPHQAVQTPQRFSGGRSLAENAALHREWRSRNRLWQSDAIGAGEKKMEQTIPFDPDKNGPHHLLLTFSPGSMDKNQLLFTTANFNFSHFKLRAFKTSYTYLPEMEALEIEPFRSFTEAAQYLEMLYTDSIFRSTLPTGIAPVIISEKNLAFIHAGNSLDEYHIFHATQMETMAVFQATIHDDTVEIEEKNRQEPEKIVSLETAPVTVSAGEELSPPPTGPVYQAGQDTTGVKAVMQEPTLRIERETPEALQRRLEENAAKALQQQQETTPRKSRQQMLKEREQQRKERVRQRERELKERQREREAALKQRERERTQKIREQQ